MDYTLRELECFLVAAEELSFTRAAQRLHLAQPPLSRHIHSLEEKLGCPLFERFARGVILTSAGALFFEESRSILPQLRRAGEAVRRAALGEESRLKIGFVSAALSPELIRLCRRFREKYPTIQLILQDLSPADQLQAIKTGMLDGGFIGLKPNEVHQGIQMIPWQKEPIVCFLPYDHRLASKHSLTLKELKGETFAAVSNQSAPAFASFVRVLCENAGFRPKIAYESPRAQAVAVMVAAGAGVALLPESVRKVTGESTLVLPLRPSAQITHMFARRAGHPSLPVKQFLQAIGSND